MKMIRSLLLAVCLGIAGCAPPPPGTRLPTAVNDDPALKRPVTITTLEGSQFKCQAGPGAICVQK